jgi:soluble lytic murein transglycosylase-like protein
MQCDPQRAVIPSKLPLSTFLAVVAAATALALCSDEALAPSAPEPAGACVPEETFARAAVADPSQAILVRYVSRRFLVATQAADRMVGAAYRAAREVGLDPYLVLAVIAVESRFNPIAESDMGAKGLMQIIPKYHARLLAAAGGEAALLDPEANIGLGARILQAYVYRMGTLEAGLQFYNGALGDASALYAQKVLAERERLLAVVMSHGSRLSLALQGG